MNLLVQAVDVFGKDLRLKIAFLESQGKQLDMTAKPPPMIWSQMVKGENALDIDSSDSVSVQPTVSADVSVDVSSVYAEQHESSSAKLGRSIN